MIVAICGLCVSALMLIVAIITLVKASSKDKLTNHDELQKALLRSDMKQDQILATTSETRTDIKVMQNKVNELDKEIFGIKREMGTMQEDIRILKGQ